jgi:flagellar basal-body rod modification protein FlgD
MAAISATGTTTSASTQTSGTSDALNQIDMDEFIALMIAEMQNQDPLEPMDNTQMLQQISQIREIGSNDRLSDTLGAVLLGQNMTTASNMIGQTIMALGDDDQTFVGTVDRVSIDDGEAKLHVIQTILEHYDEETDTIVPEERVEHAVSLTNISQILPDTEDTALVAQRVSAAGSLVGRTIIGVTDASEVVTGAVEQVAFEDGAVQLKVGDHLIDLDSVTHIVE